MTELITLITTLKMIGFDLAKIVEILLSICIPTIFFGFLFWKYGTPFFKRFDLAMAAITKSIQDLNTTLKTYMLETDRRMAEGDTRFDSQGKEIKEIKAHLGLK